ncbi:MAG: M24 family metallopeptidase [Chloroflexi bacterium]|nr:M24 family metallopeptidase [Chloroflexota bacterium]
MQASVDPFQVDAAGRRVLPSFSLAERDRRYGRVRELMAERNLDCLLAPSSEVGETQAPSRYLCQIGGVQGGAWVVFPRQGAVTAVLSAEREMVMWQASLSWPSDLRWGTFSELVPERVKELGMGRGRIGVTGLLNQQARPEGIIPYETWRRITGELPEATFEPANDVLDFARMRKGPEEITVIELIAASNEAAMDRMMEVAKPGMEEAEVWLEMAQVLMRHTGDYPARLSLGSNGRPANASNTMGLPIRMEDGGILSQEVDARLQGYRAQSNFSILIGSLSYVPYRGAMNAAINVFMETLQWLVPGRTVGEFAQWAADVARRHGDGGGAMMHTNGLGSDRPRFSVDRSMLSAGEAARADANIVIEPGFTFTIKANAEFSGFRAGFGEPVTITETGARRLGRREPKPFMTGGVGI